MEPISLNKYAQIIIKKWKIIAYSAGAMFILSLVFGLLFYTTTYISSAEVLIKQTTPVTFVTELNTDNQGGQFGMGQDKNPVLNQIEILSSYDIATAVAKKLSGNSSFSKYPKEFLAKRIQRAIELDTPTGTDIISIDIKWDNPEDAQLIAKTLLDCYYDYNVNLNKKSVLQTKNYINKQLADSSKKLESTREEIKTYRKNNFTVDIELESDSLVQQIKRVEDLIVDVNANISNQEGRGRQSLSNLGINLKKAIDSVALGGDPTLLKLQQSLQDAQQKYATLKVKYPVSTPEMRSLHADIKMNEDQIAKQTIALIGKSATNANNSLISDSVRSNMVSDTVKSNIELHSLRTQKTELTKILSELNGQLKQVPEKQKMLTILLEKEKTLADVVETLNAKLVEAKIKESEIISNISIIENPTVSDTESFPTKMHLTFMFLFAGIILGIGTILGLYYVDDLCGGSSDVEEVIKAPVLGTIPWLTNNTYSNFLTDYNPHSVVAIIYQKIATSIKVRCYRKKINCIGIISAELEKRRSIVAATLANTFAKTQDKVLLIDTDFRDGSLTREFNIDFSAFPDITDLILELSKNEDNGINWNEIISKYIIKIPDQHNLYLIPNNNKVNNPYEILNNATLPKLIQILKTNFDFVLVDAPPMLAVADSIITSQHVDGLVVLCGVKTSRSSLRKIRKICDENYVEILGVIARDTLTELEVPENMYIKQFSGKEL